MRRWPEGRSMNQIAGLTWEVEGLAGLDIVRGAVSEPPSTLGLDEAALINRYLRGDETAFDQIVSRYQDLVFNLSLRLLRRREEALDLSQDVFFQVYRKLGTFRRDASLRTWIYRIVINRAKNRQRWWKRRAPEMTAVAVDELDGGTAWLSSATVRSPDKEAPDQALQRKELGEILEGEIARLPFDQRTILLLKEIDGMSYDEIARTMNLPLGTVKSRLARARKALRDRLDPEVASL